MANTLTGKVALITGGSRGIGAAIAKRLALEGAAVAVTYASSPQGAKEVVRAVESAGARALAIRADSGDAAAVKNAVAERLETLAGSIFSSTTPVSRRWRPSTNSSWRISTA